MRAFGRLEKEFNHQGTKGARWPGETIRQGLGENRLKPWRQDMRCVPKIDGEYVARMEDVLDLDAETPDPDRPVVSFDESPTQLIGEVRAPIPAKPGKLGRYDCEYRRNGAVNLFVFLDVHRPWRRVKVTDRCTNKGFDFAERMRDLVDLHYHKACAPTRPTPATAWTLSRDGLCRAEPGVGIRIDSFWPRLPPLFATRRCFGPPSTTVAFLI